MKQTIRITLLLLACLAAMTLQAKTFIEPGGRAGGHAGGIVNVRGGWRNQGGFHAGGGVVRFYGAEADTINSTVPDTLYAMVVDKPGATLYLNSRLFIEHQLLLSGGVLSTIGARTDEALADAARTRRKPETLFSQQSARERTSRNSAAESSDTPYIPRVGTFVIGPDVSIYRNGGMLASPPVYTGDVNIYYLTPCDTGAELDGVIPNLRRMIIDADGGVILHTDTHVNTQLSIANTSTLTLNSHSLEMGYTANVDAYPEQINGTVHGQPFTVGTSSYNNTSLGVGISAGASIGDIYVVQYLREATIGAAQGVKRRWRIDADNDPGDRDMALLWRSSVDNGVDMSNVQAFVKQSDSWFAIGDPQNLSSAGTTRSYIINDFTYWGEWTVAASHFTLSDNDLAFGGVTVGDTETLSFTVYNDQPVTLSGIIVAPAGFTVTTASARQSRFSAAPVFSQASDEEELTRNTIGFSVPGGGAVTYDLTFEPSSAIAYEADVIIRSNATGNPSRALHVTGAGLSPAGMAVTPESVSDTLETGQSHGHMLAVVNAGDDDLNWSAQVVGYETLFFEDFEASFPPQGWTMDILQEANGWTQSPDASHSEDYSALADWHNVYDARLYTHAFTVPANARLDWWIRTQDAPIYGGEFLVEISATSPAVWDTLLLVSQDVFTQTFTHHELDLGAYAGQTVQIAFRVANNYWTNGVFIDDVAVRSLTSSLPSWLAIDGGSTISGVAPGGGQSNVSLILDAAGLADDVYNAVIVFQGDAPATPEQLVPVTMLVATPGIAVSTPSIDFGEVEIGETLTQSFTIENTGTADLEATVATPAGYTILGGRTAIAPTTQSSGKLEQAAARQTTRRKTPDNGRNTAGYTIPGGQIATIYVEFEPTETMTYAGDIVINHNAPGGQETIAVTGEGVTPEIDVTPGALTEELMAGGTSQQTLAISNLGSSTLDWSAYVNYASDRDVLLYSGFESAVPPAGWSTEVIAGAADWDQSGEDVAAGSYCARADWNYVYEARLVTPMFTCTADAALSYWIRSQDNPTYGGEFAVEVATPNGDWITLDTYNQNTLSIAFAEKTLPLGAYDGQVIRLAFHVWDNYYKDGVLLDEVTVTGSATPMQWLTLDGVIGHGGSIASGEPDAEIEVGFDATELTDGVYTADIVIYSNDLDESEITVPVTFTVATPGIAVSPATLDFNLVAVGQSTSLTFNIENTGTAELSGDIDAPAGYSVSHVARTRTRQPGRREGAESSDFAENRDVTGFTVAAGLTETYQVTFAPTSVGDWGGQLTITHNAPGENAIVALIGAGVDIPTVTTGAVTNVTATSADCAGEVASDGGLIIVERGFCWSTSANPTTDDDILAVEGETGAFSATIGPLSASMIYYVRAYAINELGTAYGAQTSFTTAADELTPPQNVTIVLSGGQVILAWDEVTGANSYYVYAAADPEGAWTNVTASGGFGGSASRVEWTAAASDERLYYYVTSSTDVTRE